VRARRRHRFFMLERVFCLLNQARHTSCARGRPVMIAVDSARLRAPRTKESELDDAGCAAPSAAGSARVCATTAWSERDRNSDAMLQ
jgi:hypothetical protein